MIYHGGHRGHRERSDEDDNQRYRRSGRGLIDQGPFRPRPGLLENPYHACLAYELRKRGFKVLTQVELPVTYDEIRIDLGYRIDLLVEDSVVVEIKAVTKLARVHEAQLLSYLKLGGYRAGLLINFHAARLRDGIKRMVN